ncbi:MAG TPA: hypothetical protein VGC15_12900 [Acetobacteraceae bacterium]
MPSSLRLRVAGLHDEHRVASLKRSLGLVANVESLTVDEGQGELIVNGGADEHLVLVHLANEGFEAYPVHKAPQHSKL